MSDPLTGFFLVRVKALALQALHPKGFKILLEILVRNPNLNKGRSSLPFWAQFSGRARLRWGGVAVPEPAVDTAVQR